MIRKIHIENFKCFRDFDIELDRFSVLVGSNGSGKTAFLQAAMIAAKIAANLGRILEERVLAEDLGIAMGRNVVWRQLPSAVWRIEVSGPSDAARRAERVLRIGPQKESTNFVECQVLDRIGTGMPDIPVPAHDPTTRRTRDETVGRADMFRFSPRSLKASDTMRENPGMAEDGSGFPGFLDGILRRGGETFRELEQEFCTRFPEYRQLAIPFQKQLSLSFHTRHGTELPAGSVSDGTILSLAFLAVCCQPDPPEILLVEEPENGVHPRRLKEIIETLRYLSSEKGVQVILTTHSPYLLDLVQDDEVWVFAKDEDGAAHAKRLSDFDDVAAMKKDFMTGEIWSILSEAQGI